jgi:SAM-dependent methyltransferase
MMHNIGGYGMATLSPTIGQAVNYPRWIVDYFCDYLGKSVLEVGLGFSNYQAMYGAEVFVGVDVDADIIALARQNSAAPLVKATLGAPDFAERVAPHTPKGGFDCCICLNTMQYLENEHYGVGQLLEQTRVGGHVCMLIPAHPWLYGPMDHKSMHRHRYSSKQVEALTRHDNARLLRHDYFNCIGGAGWLASNLLMRFFKSREGSSYTLARKVQTDAADRAILFYDLHLVRLSRLLQPLSRHFFGLSHAIVVQRI